MQKCWCLHFSEENRDCWPANIKDCSLLWKTKSLLARTITGLLLQNIIVLPLQKTVDLLPPFLHRGLRRANLSGVKRSKRGQRLSLVRCSVHGGVGAGGGGGRGHR